MKKKTTIVGFNETGIFNPKEWLDEAETQFFSSNLLRNFGKEKLLEAKKANSETITSYEESKIFNLVDEKEKAYKSSILLISYAVELILKAGVVSFYRSIPKCLVNEELKRNYSHNLIKIVNDLSIELTKKERALLVNAQDFILEKARYPINPDDVKSYFEEKNINNDNIQSEEFHDDITLLYKKLLSHVRLIDRDTDNPVQIWKIDLDQDGYIVLRVGGNLPERMTVKYSSLQIANKENDIDSLYNFIEENSSEHHFFKVALHHRDSISVFEHVIKNTLKKRN